MLLQDVLKPSPQRLWGIDQGATQFRDIPVPLLPEDQLTFSTTGSPTNIPRINPLLASLNSQNLSQIPITSPGFATDIATTGYFVPEIGVITKQNFMQQAAKRIRQREEQLGRSLSMNEKDAIKDAYFKLADKDFKPVNAQPQFSVRDYLTGFFDFSDNPVVETVQDVGEGVQNAVGIFSSPIGVIALAGAALFLLTR